MTMIFDDHKIVKQVKEKRIKSTIMYLASSSNLYETEKDVLRYLAKNLKKNFACLLYDKELLEDGEKILGNGKDKVSYFYVPDSMKEEFSIFNKSVNVFLLNDTLEEVIKNKEYGVKELDLCIKAISYKEEKPKKRDNTTWLLVYRKEILVNDSTLLRIDPFLYMKIKGKRSRWFL